MGEIWDGLKALAWNLVWATNLTGLPKYKAGLLRALRTGHMVLREMTDGELNLRAAGLVYTTLLSLVPALAVSFAVMKAFNVHEALEPTLIQLLAPLGSKGAEIGTQIIGFVEELKLAQLGSVGLAVLMFTVISLVHKIELAMNRLWRVERPRALFERFSGYLTVVMIGPLLVFTALGMSASIVNSDFTREMTEFHLLGFALDRGAKMVPYLFVIAAFASIYIYIPNTKVKIRCALVGAVVAGILWGSLGWVFAAMVVTSARYTLVYSSFAIVILFMMWLYIGWLILLVGGSIAFYQQNPEYLGLLTHELQMSNAVRERLGLTVCYRVASRFRQGAPPPTLAELSRDLDVPVAPLHALLKGLESNGVVVRVTGPAMAYLPARALATIELDELVDTLRRLHESGHLNSARVAVDPAVDRVLLDLEQRRHAALAGRTLEDLVKEGGAEGQPEAGTNRIQGAPVPIRPQVDGS